MTRRAEFEAMQSGARKTSRGNILALWTVESGGASGASGKPPRRDHGKPQGGKRGGAQHGQTVDSRVVQKNQRDVAAGADARGGGSPQGGRRRARRFGSRLGRRWPERFRRVPPRQARTSSSMNRFFAKLLDAYHAWLSPFLPGACRFHPSCSVYAAQSLPNPRPLARKPPLRPWASALPPVLGRRPGPSAAARAAAPSLAPESLLEWASHDRQSPTPARSAPLHGDLRRLGPAGEQPAAATANQPAKTVETSALNPAANPGAAALAPTGPRPQRPWWRPRRRSHRTGGTPPAPRQPEKLVPLDTPELHLVFSRTGARWRMPPPESALPAPRRREGRRGGYSCAARARRARSGAPRLPRGPAGRTIRWRTTRPSSIPVAAP